MAQNFNPGDRVKWQSGSETKVGTVVAIVPAGKNPSTALPEDSLNRWSMKLLGHLPDQKPRQCDSYLVEVSIGGRGIAALIWPNAELLENAH